MPAVRKRYAAAPDAWSPGAGGRGADPARSGERTADADPTSDRNRATRAPIRRRSDAVEAHETYLVRHDPTAAARERDSAPDPVMLGTPALLRAGVGRGASGGAH